ncbi:MAG: hypothetical protein RL334_634, partial [Chloroflexota bacterium]
MCACITLVWCGLVFVISGCRSSGPPLYLVTAPVVPVLTAAVQQALLQQHSFGLRRGMRPGVFSIVGDSISSNKYFLKPLAHGTLNFGSYAGLEPMVEYYRRIT